MKILIVDDTQGQLDLAKVLLKEHEVTTASGYGAARNMLVHDDKFNNPLGFDVVLTDMMMPGEGKGLGGNIGMVGKLVPYGMNVAMLALRCGVPKVAVVSNGQGKDGNHHQDPILWACDDLHGFNFEGRLMFFTGYDCPHMGTDREEVKGIECPYYLKDWVAVLKTLLNSGTPTR